MGEVSEHAGPDDDPARPRIEGLAVDLAARICALARPAQILMSAAVADSARQRVANNSFAQPICWQAHGPYPVKGFDGTIEIREAGLESVAPFVAPPRAQPVSSPGSANRVLPAKPSIAVLPFANLSNDPEQAYFADGMMEEITTALSRIRSIFVIASGSTQSLRGKTSAPQEIGHQLGVRYILEGSVRKASNRVRIGVTLIDASDGAQIWAERFEDTLEDVFALQDKVAVSVAGVIEPTIREAEIRHLAKRPTENMSSYDLFLRASALVTVYEKTEIFTALELLDQAIALDQNYALAFSLAAYCHAQVVVTGWSDDPEMHRRLAVDLAQRALRVGGDDAEVLSWVTGTYLPLNEDIDTSIALIDRSIALNPGSSFAWHMSGWLHAASGEADLAVEHFKTAMRLDPCSTDRFYLLSGIALARFDQRRFGEAIALLKESLQLQASVSINQALLAACYAHLGKLSAAQAALADYRKLSSIEIQKRITLFHKPEHRQLFLDGIALAEGLAGASSPSRDCACLSIDLGSRM